MTDARPQRNVHVVILGSISAKFVQDIGSTAKPPPGSPSGGNRLPPTSENIAQRLRSQLTPRPSIDSLSQTAISPSHNRTLSTDSHSTEKGDTDSLAKLDKGKGREVVSESPTPLSPTTPMITTTFVAPTQPPLLLAGLSLPRATVSNLMERARAEMPLRPVRFPILGEYQDCFSGEEFVLWLKDHIDGLGGSLERAEEAARDLTEGLNVLRRIGEFGLFPLRFVV